MKRWMKDVTPDMRSFILGPCGMIIEVIGEMFMPLILGKIINDGYEGTLTVGKSIFYASALIVIVLIMLTGGVAGAYYGSKASVNFAGDLRQDVFEKIQKFSFANIEKFSTGSLVTRLTNDITNVQNLVAMALRMMLRAPGMFIGALIMAFLTNAKLALVIVIVIPVLLGVLLLIMKKGFPRF